MSNYARILAFLVLLVLRWRQRRRERQAASWYYKLQDPNLPRTEWQRFEQWGAVSAQREAFDSVAADWEQLRRMPWPVRLRESSTRPGRALTIAARCAAVLLLAVALQWPNVAVPPQILVNDGHTATAVALDDGSMVSLAPDTRLAIDRGTRQRSSYLEHGQAFFDVAKDPARPFRVRTNLVVAEALGTRFGVSSEHEESVVTVMEGVVAVSPAPSEETQSQAASLSRVEITAGQQLRFRPGQSFFVRRVDPDQALGWARIITFSVTPVIEAVAEFNRRNRAQIELLNPAAARNIKISGGFPLDRAEAFAQYVADKTSAPVTLREPDSPGTKPRLLQPNKRPPREAPL